MSGESRPFRLPLRTPLDTGAGRTLERAGALLVLRDDRGRTGVGEAAPLPGHPAFAHEDAARVQIVLADLVEELSGVDPALAFASAGERVPPGCPSARFALETAAADLAAQARDVRLAEWLSPGRAPHRDVGVNALIAGVDADEVATAARAAIPQGFETFKLKVGVVGLAEDRKRVEALRSEVGPLARIRLDANGAWSPALARDALAELSPFGLEYVEDPTPVACADDVAAFAALQRAVSVLLAADECLVDPVCLEAVLEEKAASVLVLKPAPMGGLAEVHKLAARAADRGIATVLTSTIDAAVGLTASLHLAASLDCESAACGLGTAGWLAEDVGRSPEIVGGRMALPSAPGLGVRLAEDFA